MMYNPIKPAGNKGGKRKRNSNHPKSRNGSSNNNDGFEIDPTNIDTMLNYFRVDNRPLGAMRNHESFMEYYLHRTAALNEIIAEDASDIVEVNSKLPEDYLFDEDVPRLDREYMENLKRINRNRYQVQMNKHLETTKLALDINNMKKKVRDDYNRKLKAVYSAMVKFYGNAVLLKVQVFMKAKEYFIAWHTLDEYYLGSQITTKRIYIENVIRHSYFDPEKHNISEFIEKFKILLELESALLTVPLGDRQRIDEIQRAVCSYDAEFYSIVNTTVDNHEEIRFQDFCSILVQHHQKKRMFKLSNEKFKKAQASYYKGNNNNGTNNNRGNNNNPAAGNNNESSSPPNGNNSEANNANAKSKRPILCWDCGKPGLKSGHDGCATPGSKKFKPANANFGKNNKGNQKEAHNVVANNPIVENQKQYEKMYRELSDQVKNVQSSMTAYTESIQPFLRQNNFEIEDERFVNDFLETNQNQKEGNNVVTKEKCSSNKTRNNSNAGIVEDPNCKFVPTIDCMIFYPEKSVQSICCRTQQSSNSMSMLEVSDCNMLNSTWKDFIPETTASKYNLKTDSKQNNVKQNSKDQITVLTPNAADYEFKRSRAKALSSELSTKPPDYRMKSIPEKSRNSSSRYPRYSSSSDSGDYSDGKDKISVKAKERSDSSVKHVKPVVSHSSKLLKENFEKFKTKVEARKTTKPINDNNNKGCQTSSNLLKLPIKVKNKRCGTDDFSELEPINSVIEAMYQLPREEQEFMALELIQLIYSSLDGNTPSDSDRNDEDYDENEEIPHGSEEEVSNFSSKNGSGQDNFDTNETPDEYEEENIARLKSTGDEENNSNDGIDEIDESDIHAAISDRKNYYSTPKNRKPFSASKTIATSSSAGPRNEELDRRLQLLRDSQQDSNNESDNNDKEEDYQETIKSRKKKKSISIVPMQLRPKNKFQSFKNINRNYSHDANMATIILKNGEIKYGEEAVAIIKQLPVLDTGATDHIANGRPVHAVNIRKCGEGRSLLLGGDETKAVDIIEVCDSDFLKDILVCPSMKRSLISLSLFMQPPYININCNDRCYVYDSSQPNYPLILSGTRYEETRLPMADIVTNGPSFIELLKQLSPLNGSVAVTSNVEALNPDLTVENYTSGSKVSSTNDNFIVDKSQGWNRNIKSKIPETVKSNGILKDLCDQLNISEENFIRGSAPPVRRAAISLLSARERLHNRSGHIGDHRLDLALRNHVCIGLDTSIEEFSKIPQIICEICELAKFKRFHLPASLKLSPEQLSFAITIDYKQFNTISQRGNKYFTLVLHCGTTYLFGILAKSKSEMNEQIINIGKTHFAKFGIIMKRIHSDSDAIYQSTSIRNFATENNIELTFTAPYRHEGSIEKYMQSVLDMLRSMMIDGNISTYYWDYVLMNAVLPTINAFPNAKFPKSSPYQQLVGKPYDISKFRPVGYPTIIWLSPHERETKHPGQPKAIKGVVLGYSDEVKNGYLVLVNKSIYVRRDIIVNENYSILRSRQEMTKEFAANVENIFNLCDSSKGITSNNKLNEKVFAKDDINLERSDSQLISKRETRTYDHPETSFDDNLLPAASRRSSRERKPVDRFMYLTTSNPAASSEIKSDTLPKQPLIEYKSGDILPATPRSFHEAINDANKFKLYWLEACLNEMNSMLERNVFEYVDMDEYRKNNNGKLPVGFKSKLAFRASTLPLRIFGKEGLEKLIEVIKFKARLVACGYSQLPGVHYNSNNSPTACYRSVMVLFAIACLYEWYKEHFDIGSAYLEALIDKELYMYLPLDWTNGRKILVKLNRNLYGLKQAGLLWYLLLKSVLKDLGYHPSIWDPCVFIKKVNNQVIAIIGVHVDDEAIISNSKEEIDNFKDMLSKRFKKVSNLSSLTEFLGIRIETDENGLYFYLSQRDLIDRYIRDLASGIGEIRSSLPGPSGENIEDIPANKDNQPIWDEIGSISHIAQHTRPDLACVCGILGKFQRYPNQAHLQLLKQANNYLNNTKDFKLKIGGTDKEIKLFIYCDSSYKRGGDGKSRFGIAVFLNKTSGAVYWKSQQSKTVATSSTEAEIGALVEAVKDAIWFRGLLSDIGFKQNESTVIYQDNAPLLHITEMQSTPVRTRHLMNRIHFIKQEIELKTIKLVKIPDRLMVADSLTKLVPVAKHAFCTKILLEGHDGKLP